MSAGGGEHCLALDNVHADRLLHPYVDPRLTGGDHRQRMPVVGRLDEHKVEVLRFEHLAVVPVCARFLSRGLARGNQISRFGQHAFIDIAEGHDFHRGDLDQTKQVALAIPAAANQPDSLFLVGEFRGVVGERGQSQGSGAGFEEFSAVHGPVLDAIRDKLKPSRRADCKRHS